MTTIDSEGSAATFLYGLAPESFVDARNQLVKQLRTSGQRELAAAVALMRRPNVIAGELNRVLRLDPALVEHLIDAADALRDGHQQVLEGDPVDLTALQRAHRQLARQLAELSERNQADVLSAIESASLDESCHDRLRAASFATEPAPQTGFDLLTPTATVISLTEARAKRAAREKATEARSKATEAKTRAARARAAVAETPPGSTERAEAIAAADRELEASTNAHRLAERRVEAARRTETKGRERVQAMEEQLVAARDHLTSSGTKLGEAEAALERARERLEAAQAVLQGPDVSR